MFGIAYSFFSAISWGTADFLGGLVSRKLNAAAVVFWSQIAGFIMMVIAALVSRVPPTLADFGWGAAAGLCGAVGLLLFYRGLAIGPMSIVSPISGTAAVVPFFIALFFGSPPALLAILGAPVALLGVFLASKSTDTPSEIAVKRSFWHSGVPYAIGTALMFGLFLTFAAEGALSRGSSPLWIIAFARMSSPLLIFALSRIEKTSIAVPISSVNNILIIGFFDTGANALYTYAASLANFGAVSVIGSLYPVMTVLLARIVLREKLQPAQYIGVFLALLGTAIISMS